jgi:hypothetical protein
MTVDLGRLAPLGKLHRNVLAVALANKLARIAWSVLARGQGFEARPAMASAA